MQDLNDKINNGGATADGQLSADEWNQPTTETQNAIVASGQALSGADLQQLIKAISLYSTVGDFYTGGGIVNVYTASVVSPRIAPAALVDDMKIRLIVPITNTGSSTINAFGSGVINIKTQGGINDIAAGAIVAGDEITLTYKTAPSTHWALESTSQTAEVGEVINFAGAAPPVGFLLCDGSEISQVTYAELFAKISTLWNVTGGAAAPAGGNFRIPPSEIGGLGLFMRGKPAAGNVVGTYEIDVFKEHSHGYLAPAQNNQLQISTQTAHLIATNSNTDLTGDPTETRPRSITVLFCIKY